MTRFVLAVGLVVGLQAQTPVAPTVEQQLANARRATQQKEAELATCQGKVGELFLLFDAVKAATAQGQQLAARQAVSELVKRILEQGHDVDVATGKITPKKEKGEK